MGIAMSIAFTIDSQVKTINLRSNAFTIIWLLRSSCECVPDLIISKTQLKLFQLNILLAQLKKYPDIFQRPVSDMNKNNKKLYLK